MSDNLKLAQLLFPNITETPDDMEAKFPPRNLKEGVRVTRLAPSPTGFLHFGNLFAGTVAYRTAKTTDGIFFVRVEDTDQKRKIEGAVKVMLDGLEAFGVTADEGVIGEDMEKGDYGPYYQSKRKDIYHVFAKTLVEKDLAYPCFCSAEELDEIRAQQENEPQKGYWGKYAKCRNLTLAEIEEKISAGAPWTLRLKSPGNAENKCFIDDMIKGKIEMPENVQDIVLLKSDGIPTYHFAHAVDDHLMGTTHVIRGEEWLPSLPKHIQLFAALGFKLPKYMHIAQIMKLDENGNKKKLSKRDMGANMDDYTRMGYAPECVCEYIMTLLNSNYEEWHMQNADKPYTEFPFNIKKMSVSGCLFDFGKLNDVSKNIISRMSAEEVTAKITAWALEFDAEFGEELAKDKAFSEKIFAIGRGGKKPRKDLATWADAKPYMGFFYDAFFKIEDNYPENFDKNDIVAALTSFAETYDEADDMNTWFDKVKAIAEGLGYASDMKAYKADPAAFKGNVADISMFIRVAVTGKMNAPDLYTVMQIIGKEKTLARINSMINNLK